MKEWGGSHSWPGVLQLTPPNSPSTPALVGVGLGASAHMICEARNNMSPRNRLGHVSVQHATVQYVAVQTHITRPNTQAEFRPYYGPYMAVKQCERIVFGHSDASYAFFFMPVMKACRAQVLVKKSILPLNRVISIPKRLFNSDKSILQWKSKPRNIQGQQTCVSTLGRCFSYCKSFGQHAWHLN